MSWDYLLYQVSLRATLVVMAVSGLDGRGRGAILFESRYKSHIFAWWAADLVKSSCGADTNGAKCSEPASSELVFALNWRENCLVSH